MYLTPINNVNIISKKKPPDKRGLKASEGLAKEITKQV